LPFVACSAGDAAAEDVSGDDPLLDFIVSGEFAGEPES
jgi:hypothetical protein